MRYVGLFALQLRLSLAHALQYRWEFMVESVLAIAWTAIAIVPIHVAFADRPAVSGWTYDRALVVVGHFTLLKALLDGAVSPSLVSVIQRIRFGTLDFLLLKPADSQFLVSTAKFEVHRVVDALAAFAIFAIAFARMGRAPSLFDVALSTMLLFFAALVLYALTTLVVAAAFWVVRLDNLTYLFSSVLDFARWPVDVLRGAWAFVFTYVIPVAVMTTFPAEALLGSLDVRSAITVALVSMTLAAFARSIWVRAIRRYTSASS